MLLFYLATSLVIVRASLRFRTESQVGGLLSDCVFTYFSYASGDFGIWCPVISRRSFRRYWCFIGESVDFGGHYFLGKFDRVEKLVDDFVHFPVWCIAVLPSGTFQVCLFCLMI